MCLLLQYLIATDHLELSITEILQSMSRGGEDRRDSAGRADLFVRSEHAASSLLIEACFNTSTCTGNGVLLLDPTQEISLQMRTTSTFRLNKHCALDVNRLQRVVDLVIWFHRVPKNCVLDTIESVVAAPNWELLRSSTLGFAT